MFARGPEGRAATKDAALAPLPITYRRGNRGWTAELPTPDGATHHELQAATLRELQQAVRRFLAARPSGAPVDLEELVDTGERMMARLT